MIGIINYGVGNLRSVQKAFEHVGAQATLLTQPRQIADVQRLVLPGVGAFGDGMQLLRQHGWVEPLHEWIDAGKPLLGICLGMQLLFEHSQEGADRPDEPVPGLGVLPGHIVRFREEAGDGRGGRLKVPHMGWNSLSWQRDDPLLAGLDPEPFVYFVHGYHVEPDPAHDVTSAVCDYGGPFPATVWRDRIWATQFHPEKSQRVGLHILANFNRI